MDSSYWCDGWHVTCSIGIFSVSLSGQLFFYLKTEQFWPEKLDLLTNFDKFLCKNWKFLSKNWFFYVKKIALLIIRIQRSIYPPFCRCSFVWEFVITTSLTKPAQTSSNRNQHSQKKKKIRQSITEKKTNNYSQSRIDNQSAWLEANQSKLDYHHQVNEFIFADCFWFNYN